MKNTPEDTQASAGSSLQDQIDHLAGLYRQGRFQEVALQGEVLAEEYPSTAVIFNILGAANAQLGQWEQAAGHLAAALQCSPGYNEHYNLGVALQHLGRREEAIEQYTEALRLNPDLALANSNLGLIFNELRQHDAAIECCERALELNPDLAEAHVNLGLILNRLGRHDEAIEYCKRALEINPDSAEGYDALGNVLRRIHRYDEAIECFDKAIRINPDFNSAHSLKLFLQASICDWDSLSEETQAIAALGLTGVPVTPFAMLALEDHPARHLRRAELQAKNKFNFTELSPIPRPATRPDRLRIGYFSGDFRNHPVSYLIARLFELHNRDRFSLHAYSFGPSEPDEMRIRLKAAFDVFHDVSQMSDKEIAELARREGVHIAVDLNGYTAHARSGVFANRAAPIQINYLGYPGSMGAPFIDYIIADRTIIPENHEQYYSEKVIYLPHTYQANDNTRKIPDALISRAEQGLPETGFVFCCFNNSYKITSDEFDIWMRLLDKVEGSVLWLLKANEGAEANLAQEAQRLGIDPDRLIFAEKLPVSEHLARHRLADLFLDTFNYNAHTTASDALWAGLPLVTKLGQGFAARVAGSLLKAIGLPELIVGTREEYENLALNLALDPEKLGGIRARLLKNRETAPLFDTALFTRNIENAYCQAYQRYFEGLAPDTISVHTPDGQAAP